MWKEFDGTARNREQTLERINALKWTDWRPQGITLHNTAAPTLAQWAESGPAHDARIRNLQSFYEHELGWHAGPHWFVSRNWINWFSNPLLPGVHSRCFNATRFGIEMVGDYNSEEFNSGDGALVRDNAVFLIAALNLKFGFDPEDLKFHVECTRDNHDCPGQKVAKGDVISRVRAMMNVLKSNGAGIQHPQLSGTTPATTRFLNITATEFGGEGDEQPVAYNDVPRDWPRRPGVALPARFSGARPKVRVLKGSKSVVCDIVDVGPWYPSARGPQDKYWETGGRPRAESDGRTNRAGIDLTPAAAAAIGLDGKGIVDWEFVGTQLVEVPKPSTTDLTLAELKEQLERLEIMIRTRPTPPEITPPSDSDLGVLLKQVMSLINAVKGQSPATSEPTTVQPEDRLKKIIDLLRTLSGGVGGEVSVPPGKLGQVNGALGETIGKLLDGKKSAIGILGALVTAILEVAGPEFPISKIIPIVGSTAGLGGVAMPIFLALSAWGILGKMEKWAGASPPTKAQ
jgi:hypothetical protein